MINDQYELLEVIGAGSTGIVYKALRHADKRYLALKKLKPLVSAKELARALAASGSRAASVGTVGKELPPFAKESLRNEFRYMAALRHPNLAEIYDLDVDKEGSSYLVFELLEGQTLSDLISTTGLVRHPDQIRNYTTQILRGLSFLHTKGFLHRDIKPANVFVCADQRIKILDFNLLRRQSLPESGTAGTLAYCAPELLHGEASSTASDLFAVGLTVYEVIRGKALFDDAREILDWELPVQPLLPTQTRGLNLLLENLLDPNPRTRCQSAEKALALMDGRAAQLDTAINIATRRSYILSSKILERDVELQRLQHAFMEAQAGKGGVLLISGESGIGKSRLADEFAVFVKLNGGQCFKGSFDEHSHDPYAALKQMLRPIAAICSQSIIERYYNELCFLLPELEKRYGPPKHRAYKEAAKESTLCNLVLSFIIDVAVELDLAFVLLFEDLHFQPKHKLLELAKNRLQDSPVMIVATLRDDEADPALLAAFAHSTITLKHLSRNFFRKFADDIFHHSKLDEQFFQDLEQYTTGNPLFIEQLFLELNDRGVLQKFGDRWKISHYDFEEMRLPLVEEILERRRQNLTDDEKRCMRYIAASPHGIETRLLTELMPGPRGSEAIAGLLRAHNIAEEGGKLRATHHQIRMFFYSGITVPSATHRELGELLENFDSRNVYDLAYHFERCNDSVKKGRYLRMAGDFAFRTNSYREAFGFYRSLYSHLKSSDCTEDELLDVLLLKSRIAHSTGEWSELEGDLREALERVDKTANSVRLGKVYTHLSNILMAKGIYPEASRFAKRALDILEALHAQDDIAYCHSLLAQIAERRKEFKDALHHYEQARALYLRSGEKLRLAQATGNIGTVYLEAGRLENALRCFRESLAVAEELQCRHDIAVVLGNIGIVYLQMCQFNKASEYFTKALELRRTLANKRGVASAHYNIATIHIRSGDYASALQHLESASSLALELEDGRGLGLIAIGFAWTHAESRRMEAASLWARYALRKGRELQDKAILCGVFRLLGNVCAYQERCNEALEWYVKCMAMSTGWSELFLLRSFESIGKFYFDIEQYKKATPNFARMQTLSEKLNLAADLADSSFFLAESLLAQQKHRQARQHIRRGLRAATATEIEELQLRGKALVELVDVLAQPTCNYDSIAQAVDRLEKLQREAADVRGTRFVWHALWQIAGSHAVYKCSKADELERYRLRALRLFRLQSEISSAKFIRRIIASLEAAVEHSSPP